MLDKEEVLKELKDETVKEILEEMGAVLFDEDDKQIIFSTICHGGHSNKLYYYKENKRFTCYTDCGNMSFYDLLENVWSYNFQQALYYLADKVGISFQKEQRTKFGIDEEDIYTQCLREEINLLKILTRQNNKNNVENINLKKYDKTILERFKKYYTEEWIEDYISIKTMEEFDIAFCFLRNKIIIPHYDIEGELIGIRTRSFNQWEIDKGMKYTPLFMGQTTFNHPLQLNFYGINKNSDNIRRKRKAIITEGEKGVHQSETYYGRENNITLASCGSIIGTYQRNLLIKLGVEVVYIAYDKQFKEKNDEDYIKWVKKIKKIVNLLSPFMEVRVLWDTEDILDYKDSPFDKGKEVADNLIRNYIKGEEFVGMEEYLVYKGVEKIEGVK